MILSKSYKERMRITYENKILTYENKSRNDILCP